MCGCFLACGCNVTQYDTVDHIPVGVLLRPGAALVQKCWGPGVCRSRRTFDFGKSRGYSH